MLTIIIFLLLSLAFGAVATFLVLKRSKLMLVKVASCVLGVSFLGLTILYTTNAIKASASNNRNLFLALSCIENNNIPKAQIYLQSVNSPNGGHQFIATCCDALLQHLNGNSTLARIKQNSIKESTLNADQKILFEFLQNYKADSVADVAVNPLASFSKQCISLLKLDSKTTQKLTEIYNLQNNSGGYIDINDVELNKKFSKSELEILQLDSSLATQNFASALEMGANMLAKKPNAKTKMIVAEVIAEMTFSGGEISDYYFTLDNEASNVGDPEAENAELKAMSKNIEKLNKKISDVQTKIDLLQNNQEALMPLLEEKEKLSKEASAIQLKHDNIYVYRAINSINDINTIESKILQSRLYFSIREREKAQDALKNAANSLSTALSSDTALVSSLNLVKDIYDNNVDASLAGTPELMAALNKLNSSVIPSLTSIGMSGLSQDITQQISNDLKYKTNDIFINSVDDSKFPQITAILSASENVLNDIKSNKNVIIKDTGTDVEYKVLTDLKESAQSVCAVIDVSGSMSGQPLMDAKNAVAEFTSTTSSLTNMALCTFSDSSDIITEMTSDKTKIQAGIDSIIEGGGTDITAGIAIGIQALEGGIGAKTIILLTDGQSGIDNNVVQEAVSKNIKIITIGVGGVDDALLASIAEQTGGTYVKAEASEELVAAFADVGAKLNNVVNIEYTAVESSDAAERYLYAKSTDYSCNSKYVYRYGAEEEKELKPLPIIERVSPAYIENAWAENYVKQDKKIAASISGSNLNLIENISFLGETISATISQDGRTCDFEISPNMAERAYDLVLNLTDGTSATVKNFITVYQRENLISYQKFKIGSLYCQPNYAIKIDDTHVMMISTRFTTASSTSSLDEPLSSHVESPILFTVEGVVPIEDPDYDFILGASGTFEYTGIYAFTDSDYITYRTFRNLVADSGQVKGVINDAGTTINVEAINNESK